MSQKIGYPQGFEDTPYVFSKIMRSRTGHITGIANLGNYDQT
jgi:hypothetical protein